MPDIGAKTEAPTPRQALRALLVIGGGWHDYAVQKDVLKQGLEQRANVQVDIVYSPDPTTSPIFPFFGDPKYAEGYDVIIHDECAGAIRDRRIIEAMLAPHRAGIPAVNLHCAIHAFRTGEAANLWPEFLGLRSMQHGPHLPIEVRFTDPGNPITKGLSLWVLGNEELYNNVDASDGMRPLARGKQLVDMPDGKKMAEEAIVVWTHEYHGARVFSTSLGHYTNTVADPLYLDLVARGLLWACGKLDEDGRPLEGYERKIEVGAPKWRKFEPAVRGSDRLERLS